MLRTALAMATAALALAVAAPSIASANDHLRVFFPGDCQTNSYKPKQITVFCADAGMVVNKIKYETYTSKRAAGYGTASVNDCVPDCASGKTSRYLAIVRLSRVRQCGDVPQFTRLRVTFPIGAPKGFRKGVRQKYRCADAPA